MSAPTKFGTATKVPIRDAEFFSKFGQVYVSATYHGVVKAWPYSTGPSLVVNVPTEPYDYSDPDEYRLDPHGTLPYDWTRKDG